ncbi:MAG: hypothetical protein EZS26_002624 [Candidatus Ordinivivax streblomastigis]|uniref:RagB/SusD family nutrient uptake outer membrane protein n=1 Tax=Candidatus Ordinivivax streblomastigis TaxID=2540710 RepID=A0A5M8NYR9_9BACT|nr:MAG: hypothetical protein EZS26_002624 [Candidatus Ordinivivax streblomastigis]
MKRIYYSLLAIAMLFTFNACQDLLETDSNRLVSDEDYQLNSPEDSYAVIAGILSELQQVADRYVLFGELRGDLMNTSSGAVVALQEINNFDVSPENEYADKRAYYNIINNCNYALQRMDTSLVIQTEKVMLPAYAEIKTIRAWTYFQLAQVFGKVVYLTEPITDLDASLTEETPIDLDNLVDKLIDDLFPFINERMPSSNVSPNSFMPTALLLGDLFLYQKQYEAAATLYYLVMYDGVSTLPNHITVGGAINRWETGFNYANVSHLGAYTNELLAEIDFQFTAKGLHSQLVRWSLNDQPSLLPARNFVEEMAAAQYFYTSASDGSGVVSYREGDLRGNIQQRGDYQVGDAYFYTNIQGSVQQEPLIFKFFYDSYVSSTGSDPENALLNKEFKYSTGGASLTITPPGLYYLPHIAIYRTPQLYLHYAEAVNRAGKPSLAFAVLKYGLKETTLTNSARVNPAELGAAYTNFRDFDNTAMAVRGRGYGIQSPTVYTIPDFTDSATATQDSIEWVEDRILEELAAETAFEGNRFFDLLCVSRSRGTDWMAKKVAAKYPDAAAKEAKLKTLANWFLQ